jgi:pimeloyl-ACP methyl ester carboxylesterase
MSATELHQSTLRGLILLGVALALFVVSAAWARSSFAGAATPAVEGFVPVAKGRDLFVRYVAPDSGRPTLVLLNGLTYREGIWDAFATRLEDAGYGVLRYDMMGQGETLRKHGAGRAPIRYQDQVKDLEILLKALSINSPVHVLGLSYGAAIGMEFARLNPSRIESLILMAPFLAPLESQDQFIRNQITATRLTFPMNPASDEELYDYFLRNLIYTTYPLAEPIVLEHPEKLEATFRLVQGVRPFDASRIAHELPDGKVHLILAMQDQYVPNHTHREFWKGVPDSKKASYLNIMGSEHKIPEAVPLFSRNWVRLIMDGDKRLASYQEFIGFPLATGRAASPQQAIEVTSAFPLFNKQGRFSWLNDAARSADGLKARRCFDLAKAATVRRM